MKILFFKSNKFMQDDVIETMREMGHNLDTVTYVFQNYDQDEFFAEKLEHRLKRICYDLVFSLNFYPVISDVCYQTGIPYVSWIYDSPAPTFFRFDRPTNKIFLFDQSECDKYQKEGYKNICYLPLASNVNRLEQLLGSPITQLPDYKYDISFLGVLYDKFNLEKQNLTSSAHDLGILKGYAAAQTLFQDLDILTPLIEQSGFLFDPERYEDLMQDLLIETTSQERHHLLTLLSNYFSIDLFSTDRTESKKFPIHFHDPVQYETEMPFVFRESRINLNITLRTIKTAIPLRVFDIISCGGFLITNPQAELFNFFEPDKDFISYTSANDLVEKCDYFIKHSEERNQIAKNAYKKVKEAHTLQLRLKKLFEML